MAAPLVVMRGITKRFGHVVANDGVDFDLRPGEIHGLLGENGSGKTTLMSILYGLHQPDGGEIRIGDRPVVVRSPREALAHGIAMIPQQFRLVPTLSVAENIALGLEAGGRSHTRFLREVARRLGKLSEIYGLQTDPAALVGGLSMGERQRIEILRALYHDSRVLLMDEPTSVLTPQEVDRLFEMLVRMARDEGRGVVVVTHKLREVLGVAHRVTVLRQGRRVATIPSQELTVDALVEAMMGRRDPTVTLARRAGPQGAAPSTPGPPKLAVQGLGLAPRPSDELATRPLRDITFEVHAGEIFGIAGVEGNGQRELEFILAGLLAPTTGTVALAAAAATAVAYIPSDRIRWGVVSEFTVAENLLLRHGASVGPLAPVPSRVLAALRQAREMVHAFGIQPPNLQARVRHLSGGNVQKVVVARELSRAPAVVVAAQPTMGLDVATAAFVRDQLRRVAAAGASVLLISSDLDEMLALCDRIAVMYHGELMSVWDAATATVETLGAAMAGMASPAARPPVEGSHGYGH